MSETPDSDHRNAGAAKGLYMPGGIGSVRLSSSALTLADSQLRVGLAVRADREELMALRDACREGFARFFVGIALDADAFVAAIGGFDCAGEFHLIS